MQKKSRSRRPCSQERSSEHQGIFVGIKKLLSFCTDHLAGFFATCGPFASFLPRWQVGSGHAPAPEPPRPGHFAGSSPLQHGAWQFALWSGALYLELDTV